MEYRDPSDIVSDVKAIRADGAKIEWPITEIVADMEVLASNLIVDSKKFVEKGNKSAGKRVRAYTLALETLGLAFRTKSVKNDEGSD
jgi:hypothetical protein